MQNVNLSETRIQTNPISGSMRRLYMQSRLKNWGRYIRHGMSGIPGPTPATPKINRLIHAAYSRFKGLPEPPIEIDEEQAEVMQRLLIEWEAAGHRGLWAITFHYAHQWTYQEIADHQNVSVSAVKMKMQRAKDQLYVRYVMHC